MNDDEFAARLRRLDEQHEQFFAELEKSGQRLAESRREFDERLGESRREFDEMWAERLRKWAESDRYINERLELFDQRDVAFVRRMERINEKLDSLSGQSGQIVEDLVGHKRDPDAHG